MFAQKTLKVKNWSMWMLGVVGVAVLAAGVAGYAISESTSEDFGSPVVEFKQDISATGPFSSLTAGELAAVAREEYITQKEGLNTVTGEISATGPFSSLTAGELAAVAREEYTRLEDK